MPVEDDEAAKVEGDTWDPDLEFHATGQAFSRAMDALREVHTGLSHHAELMDAPERAMAVPKVIRTLDHDSSVRLRAVLAGIFVEDVTRTDFLQKLYDGIEDEPWGARVFLGFSEVVTRHQRSPMFHSAMLTSTVSRFEAHLAMLASDYFHSAPAALNKVAREEAKEFSLADLQRLGSVEAAIEAAIESRVSKLQFGSISDWKTFFKDRLNIELTSLCDWDEIREIYERRHCVVHNNGLASTRYTSAIKSEVEVGDVLEIDEEYTTRAMITLEALGVKLLAAAWRKFGEHGEGPNFFLNRLAYAAMLADRWDYAQTINENILSHARNESEKHVAQVNVWLSIKNLHGVQKIQRSVETWDLSASSDVYRLAQAALLSDLDACFEHIDSLLARDELSAEDLATWPLLKDVRGDSRSEKYSDLMRRYIEKDVLEEPSAVEQDEPTGEAGESPHPEAATEEGERVRLAITEFGDSLPQVSGDVETKDKK